MRTANDAIVETRLILQDTVTPYRYPTGDLIRYLNNGLYALKRLRPDAFLSYYNRDLPQFVDAPESLDTKLPFATIFFEPIVMYMSGFAEMRDDEFTVDQRAGILLHSFAAQLTAPQGALIK